MERDISGDQASPIPPRTEQLPPTGPQHRDAEQTPPVGPQSGESELAGLFKQFLATVAAPGERAPRQDAVASGTESSVKAFLRMKPKEYRGGINVVEASNWLRHIEHVFDLSKCAEEDKTLMAVSMLQGEALHWWDLIKMRHGGAAMMSWEEFKRHFEDRFFPPQRMKVLEEQFKKLYQGNMTVAEYESKFTELARFAPREVDTEERKCECFENGLRRDLRRRVEMFRHRVYKDLVDACLFAERSNDADREAFEERKRRKEEMEARKDTQNNNKRQMNRLMNRGGTNAN